MTVSLSTSLKLKLKLNSTFAIKLKCTEKERGKKPGQKNTRVQSKTN